MFEKCRISIRNKIKNEAVIGLIFVRIIVEQNKKSKQLSVLTFGGHVVPIMGRPVSQLKSTRSEDDCDEDRKILANIIFVFTNC